MNNLLVGNGLSISISKAFSYKSLRETINDDLSPEVQRLFNKLDTDDFELLLSKIQDAREVIEAITDGQIIINKAISLEIKSKLIETIQEINPKFPHDHGLNPQNLNKALLDYDKVFTTNYDIYLYWGRKGKRDYNIIDYFFNNGKFDRNEVDRRGRKSIYFLHGALFIFEIENKVIKIGRGKFTTLKEAIEFKVKNEDKYPLFVSEGSHVEKLTTIKRNEYLSFCYDNLRAMDGTLDIYGHNLNPSVDQHIIDAIRESNIKNVNYYQYKYLDMSKPEQDHLESDLRVKLNKNISIIDAADHNLSKWDIYH